MDAMSTFLILPSGIKISLPLNPPGHGLYTSLTIAIQLGNGNIAIRRKSYFTVLALGKRTTSETKEVGRL